MLPAAVEQHRRPDWMPNTFTDGALQGNVKWAPWLALGGYAVWSVGRHPHTEPRTQHEQNFLHGEWEDGGFLQLAPIAGVAQTSARAEDLATVADCFDPRPITMAIDSQGAIQGIWILRGAYRPERRHPALSYNADVRKAWKT